MIEKPNCLTCLNDDCPIHPNELPFPIEVRYEINIIRDHTKEMGCFSHPGARVSDGSGDCGTGTTIKIKCWNTIQICSRRSNRLNLGWC